VGPAADPSRTTPDGGVLVFESRAPLTGFANAGHTEIYRYEASSKAGNGLTCLSCNPTGAVAQSDAELEAGVGIALRYGPPVNAITHIANVTDNGREVFFQSGDRLVAKDTDGLADVYEWQAEGTGACQITGGCVYLISTGRSAGANYLYGMTPDGHDVFFESFDLLVSQDADRTPSIYDARVEGGFAPLSAVSSCEVDACQATSAPPPPAVPASAALRGTESVGGGNTHHCAKGGSGAHRSARAHCSKKHKGKKHRHHGGRSTR
jgi:hypothetical protein